MIDLNRIYLKTIKKILPSPFTLAVLLTFLTFILAMIFTKTSDTSFINYSISLVGYWEKGFWELLTFAMQMVLILVLGHTLAISPFFSRLIDKVSGMAYSTSKAGFMVSSFAVAASYLNWGFSLIVGAILARRIYKVAEKRKININYPVVAAAGYSGLMTWHGGFSGSAPLKVAETDHFLIDQTGAIPISETILSAMNVTSAAILIILIPLLFYYLGKLKPVANRFIVEDRNEKKTSEINIHGAEKLDRSRFIAWIFGGIMVLWGIYQAFHNIKVSSFSFINLNYINFILFGSGLLFHSSVYSFTNAASEAVKGATGIIIQFPIYAGIMGIMNYSGLVGVFSNFFFQISDQTTFPLFTFFSGAIVNFFVPSGGGQWAVQGPIIAEAANALSVSLPKAVMALSYGDQLTNMIQPFWALPLLGITGLKARDILPYSFILMFLGFITYSAVLLFF